MELGKNIAKIRKDNNLTQDDFAEKYFVTRQTISNWEIGKSYPDLETLVKISNDFNISLDILLKEDNKMVQEIDKGVKGARKYKNILKYIIIFISIIILAFLVYLAMYLHFEKKVMNKFSEIAEKYDLKQDNVNMYMFKKGDSIIYSTIPEPIPKILDFKLNFAAPSSSFDTGLFLIISICFLNPFKDFVIFSLEALGSILESVVVPVFSMISPVFP